MKQFNVGFHKAIKKLLNLSYHESNHFASQEANILMLDHLVNKIRLLNFYRILTNPPNIIEKMKDYFYITSIFINKMIEIFRIIYDVDDIIDNDKDALIERIKF